MSQVVKKYCQCAYQKRNQLLPENVDKKVFLHDNMKVCPLLFVLFSLPFFMKLLRQLYRDKGLNTLWGSLMSMYDVIEVSGTPL